MAAAAIPAVVTALSAILARMGQKKESFQQIPRYNQGQQNYQNNLLGNLSNQNTDITQNPLYQSGSNALQRILGGDTSQFEAPLMRQFNEEIIPNIASRFSSIGAGSQGGSDFQHALGDASAGLTERLGALRGGLQLQAAPQALNFAQQPMNNLYSLLQYAMQPQSDTLHRPGGPGAFSEFAAPFTQQFAGQFGQNAGQHFYDKYFGTSSAPATDPGGTGTPAGEP